ncbi:MAG: CPBP family intramembrane metalloprotease [Chloroflexi bacterium]|nr:CPBP family intramembrane metalloprotease [Chloroflexota bacterium]
MEAQHTYGARLGLTSTSPRIVLPTDARRASAAPDSRRSVAGLALGSLAAFAAAELLTTYGSPIAGIALHAVILTALIAAAGAGSDIAQPSATNRLLYSLTLVPLIRILSLSMPLARFDPALWYVMAGLPVFLAALVIMGPLGLRPAAIGLRLSRSPLQPCVVLLGFALGFFEYQILRPQPLIDELTPMSFILPALILLIATGFLEEFLFRGILQTVATPVLSGFAVLYVSLVFAILHIGYRSATDVAFVLAIALIYGWVVRRTGSIMGVSMSHGITNIMLFLVVPFIPALTVRPEWLFLP